MSRSQIRKPGDIRKQHNNELIRRMRKGESLTTFDSQSSWFPPRPIIEKDMQEIARLYSTASDKPRAVTFDHLRRVDRSDVVEMPRQESTWDDAG